MLPTPRVYARFPFYNLMNNEDIFVQAIAKPNPKTTLRADVHRVRLSSAGDLWYLGGGAFNDPVFGFQGRPSGGQKGLATVFDLSLYYNLNKERRWYLRGARQRRHRYQRGLSGGNDGNTFIWKRHAASYFLIISRQGSR